MDVQRAQVGAGAAMPVPVPAPRCREAAGGGRCARRLQRLACGIWSCCLCIARSRTRLPASRSHGQPARMRVQAIVQHLAAQPGGGVATPQGNRLTPRSFQLLGLQALGFSHGFERLHYLLESAWDGEVLSHKFKKVGVGGGRAGRRAGGQVTRAPASPATLTAARSLTTVSLSPPIPPPTAPPCTGTRCPPLQEFDSWMSWDTNPLYALLHESIYCQGAASNWSAQRIRWVLVRVGVVVVGGGAWRRSVQL